MYVRELLQNAVDAITARNLTAPHPGPSTLRIEVLDAPAGLRVVDSGIGLTDGEMRELLATIGRSSKRDTFDLARTDFIGQFGIGLLACFLVADEIVVRSRSATTGASAQTMLWRGRADGTFDLQPAAEPLAAAGTEVTLVAARDSGAWFTPSTVADLVTSYGSYLPVDVELAGFGSVTGQAPPWEMDDTEARDWCRREFGFEPFDVVRLAVPLAGVVGVAFVLGRPVSPTEQTRHRVYLKGMLLSDSIADVLPAWAFFARCVLDTSALRPTASREALFDDELLAETREALGTQLRDWLLRLHTLRPEAMARFLDVHHIGVKAMAVHDDAMLDLVRDALPFETSEGRTTLADFARLHPVAGYTRSVDEFRALSAVAAGQGYGLVNAGYVFDEDCLLRLSERGDGFTVTHVDPLQIGARLEPLDTADELLARPMLRAATAALVDCDCDVALRRFSPVSMPALYLPEPDSAGRSVARSGRDGSDDFWSGIVDAADGRLAPAPTAQLVLNHLHPLVRALSQAADPDLVGDAVRGLYGQALLQGRHPMRPADTALLNGALLSLVERATRVERE